MEILTFNKYCVYNRKAPGHEMPRPGASLSLWFLLRPKTRNYRPATRNKNQNIKDAITNAVNQGFIVRVPQTELTYEDWTGTGYIMERASTGEAGYMLSGQIAGGMTA